MIPGRSRSWGIDAGSESGDDGAFVVEGARKRSATVVRVRLLLTMLGFAFVYGAIAIRLVLLGLAEPQAVYSGITAADSVAAARPDLVDRRGELLATDVRMASLYAEPVKLIDPDEVLAKLSGVLADLDMGVLRKRLRSNAGFVWIKREISPQLQAEIHRLGIPGIGFVNENKRFYPGGATASHILGHVDIDNRGIAGIEKYIDSRGLADLQALGFATARSTELKPVRLSLDLRVQHVVRDELARAMRDYEAIAAAGIVLDVTTGEVIGMSSLPDYDPNRPAGALQEDRINRATEGVFELGSTFKAFTTAMALDSGRVRLSSKFDARQPIRIGRFTIDDFHGKRRVLKVPEIFIYSSNIGTAKMAQAIGIETQRTYLRRFGLLDRLQTELPEVGTPIVPARWSELTSLTVSFGHGISVSPMQAAVAGAALVNGGFLMSPTFLPRSVEEARRQAVRVISPQTSAAMRKLLRLNVVKGTGKRARVEGYVVGGKTGTAEKVVKGRYSSSKRLNTFLAAFPMDAPRYLVLVMLDEPKRGVSGTGATAGVNAAPTAGAIIERIGPMLGIPPRRPGIDGASRPVSDPGSQT